MEPTDIAAFALCCVAAAACGGTTASPGTTCGLGTMLVNGQCEVQGTGGATGGSSGAMNSGGAAGDSMSATGGNAGGAVDAATMAPPADFCAGHDVVAAGSPGLLDDFEDGEANVLRNDGRGGAWSLFAEGCTPMPAAALPLPELPVPGATVNNASKYALRVTGSGCKDIHDIGALNAFYDGTVGGHCAYDASAYDGIYFWAIGAGVRADVLVGLRSTTPVKYGGDGSCAQDAMDKGCFDHYAVSMPLTADWKEYSFTWSQLRQQGWGTKVPWNVKLTADVTIVGSNNDSTVPILDFSIDNVGFFKGAPPTDAPMPRQ